MGLPMGTKLLMRPRLALGMALLIALTSCAQQEALRSDPAAASRPAAGGRLEQLNALQREANALKTPLAVSSFYRERLAHSDGALHALIAQVLAATQSELGDYAAAVDTFPYAVNALRGTTAALPDTNSYQRVDAADAIVELARTRRIVLINEAHHVAQTRLLTLALLPRLRALGYTHFAAEGLDERDRDLVTRGYPVNASGTYVREPLYGEIVRAALKLGFVVVPYEATSASADETEREREQARHLMERVFHAQPEARLFVHAGYAHVHKRAGYLDAEPMRVHLQRMSGFEPLSIDQTVLRPIDAAREYRDYDTLRQRFAITATSMLIARDGKPWSLEPDYYEASVLLPPPAQRIVGRPDWLTLDGAREPVAIDLDVSEQHLPYVLEARYANENDKAVPADRLPIEIATRQAVLFLRPGSYRIAASDSAGHALLQRSLRIDERHADR